MRVVDLGIRVYRVQGSRDKNSTLGFRFLDACYIHKGINVEQWVSISISGDIKLSNQECQD